MIDQQKNEILKKHVLEWYERNHLETWWTAFSGARFGKILKTFVLFEGLFSFGCNLEPTLANFYSRKSLNIELIILVAICSVNSINVYNMKSIGFDHSNKIIETCKLFFILLQYFQPYSNKLMPLGHDPLIVP